MSAGRKDMKNILHSLGGRHRQPARRYRQHSTSRFRGNRVFRASNMDPMANIKGNTTADIRRRGSRPRLQRKSQRWRGRIRKSIMQDRRHNGIYPLYGFRMWQRTEIRVLELPSRRDVAMESEPTYIRTLANCLEIYIKLKCYYTWELTSHIAPFTSCDSNKGSNIALFILYFTR